MAYKEGKEIKEMKIISTVVSTSEVDLTTLAVGDWPAKARYLALQVLRSKQNRRDFYSQLPELRKSWLETKVEELAKLEDINSL